MSVLPFKTGLSDLLPNIRVDEYLTMIGIEYNVSWIVPAVPALTGKVYLRWRTSTEKYTITNFRQIITDQERSFYRVYTDFTGGTAGAALPIGKGRTDSTIDPDLIVEAFTGVTPVGVPGIVEPLFGQAGQGAIHATGGAATEQALRVSPPGVVFLSEFENLSEADTYMQVNIHWWEISPKAMLELKEL